MEVEYIKRGIFVRARFITEKYKQPNWQKQMSIKSPKRNTAPYQKQKSFLFICQFVARIVKTCLASTKNYFRLPLILSCSTSLSVRPPRMTTMMVVMMVVEMVLKMLVMMVVMMMVMMVVERWIFLVALLVMVLVMQKTEMMS